MGRSQLPRGSRQVPGYALIRSRPACLTPQRFRVFVELQAHVPDPDASNSFGGIFVISRTLRRLCPCRNVRTKRTKRTKSPGWGGVSLRKGRIEWGGALF